MKLNVANRNATMLHLAMGITEERSNELSDAMDKIVDEAVLFGKPMPLIDIEEQIVALCNTVEEVVFCVFTNTSIMLYNGAQFRPVRTKK